MRLGQLSRKTSTRSADIVNFLAQMGITVEDSVNSKVDDQHAKMIIERFAPHLNVEEVVVPEPISLPDPESESQPNPELTEEAPSDFTAALVQQELSTAEDTKPVIETEMSAQDEIPQVIKAPKVELQGLKVLGKIELPGPRKKESEPSEAVKTEEPTGNEQKERRRENRQNQTRSTDTRSRKNPVVLKREREERAAAEQKKEQARLEKEKRTQFYQQRVKPTAPVRAARMVDEPLVELHEEAPDEPKTWWGRFLKWLRT
jgi:hypothetical protein